MSSYVSWCSGDEYGTSSGSFGTSGSASPSREQQLHDQEMRRFEKKVCLFVFVRKCCFTVCSLRSDDEKVRLVRPEDAGGWCVSLPRLW